MGGRPVITTTDWSARGTQAIDPPEPATVGGAAPPG